MDLTDQTFWRFKVPSQRPRRARERMRASFRQRTDVKLRNDGFFFFSELFLFPLLLPKFDGTARGKLGYWWRLGCIFFLSQLPRWCDWMSRKWLHSDCKLLLLLSSAAHCSCWVNWSSGHLYSDRCGKKGDGEEKKAEAETKSLCSRCAVGKNQSRREYECKSILKKK